VCDPAPDAEDPLPLVAPVASTPSEELPPEGAVVAGWCDFEELVHAARLITASIAANVDEMEDRLPMTRA